MNIGFIATRLAGVDGVSLETAKLLEVFEEMGHQGFYCAGQLDNPQIPSRLVPAMHFTDPVAVELYQAAFGRPQVEPEIHQRIYNTADEIRAELMAFIEEFNIDLLIPQNASTIPMNISLGVAIAETAKRTRTPTLCHHHDFYWERERFLNNGIQDILDEAFPPRQASIHHITINTIMQRRLKTWRGIDALYLPNVFDFENPPPPPDDFAMTFRDAFGLSADDLIVLQPTRIIRRKGIEKAIELIRKLNDPRLVLIITGYEGDEAGEYGQWLREEADRAGIRYLFIGERVGAERDEANGTFSLWDIYPHAHFITYPSFYEGFGNALLETVYFRKPFIVQTYPMYLSDIKPAGIDAVEFTMDITEDTLAQTRQIIDNPQRREAMVAHNYEVCLQHFSYAVLRKTLNKALQQIYHD